MIDKSISSHLYSLELANRGQEADWNDNNILNSDDQEKIGGGGFATEHAHPWQVIIFMYDSERLTNGFTKTFQQDFVKMD